MYCVHPHPHARTYIYTHVACVLYKGIYLKALFIFIDMALLGCMLVGMRSSFLNPTCTSSIKKANEWDKYHVLYFSSSLKLDAVESTIQNLLFV